MVKERKKQPAFRKLLMIDKKIRRENSIVRTFQIGLSFIIQKYSRKVYSHTAQRIKAILVQFVNGFSIENYIL